MGMVVTLLGFGLKYQELSKDEQQRAVKVILSELKHNLYVADELAKNTKTLSNVANVIAETLRVKRLRINYNLFPANNIDPNTEQDANLYNKVYDDVLADGLLNNMTELWRYAEQCAAIVGTIDRTASTIASLSDRDGSRYIVEKSAYHANLPILRKITIVQLDDISALYAKTDEERVKYFRVADSVSEYANAVRDYCKEDKPTKPLLAAALATERLTVRLLKDMSSNLIALSESISKQALALESIQLVVTQ